jgi:hypothetical protein
VLLWWALRDWRACRAFVASTAVAATVAAIVAGVAGGASASNVRYTGPRFASAALGVGGRGNAFLSWTYCCNDEDKMHHASMMKVSKYKTQCIIIIKHAYVGIPLIVLHI